MLIIYAHIIAIKKIFCNSNTTINIIHQHIENCSSLFYCQFKEQTTFFSLQSIYICLWSYRSLLVMDLYDDYGENFAFDSNYAVSFYVLITILPVFFVVMCMCCRCNSKRNNRRADLNGKRQCETSSIGINFVHSVIKINTSFSQERLIKLHNMYKNTFNMQN